MISGGILLFVIIMAAMLLFAVLSNGLVIYCVIKIKKLRTITNVFICNLSVSDILLAGFIMPQRLHDVTHKENFFEGKLLCKMVNFFPIFVITSSVYTLVCISFERNRVILNSYTPRMTYRKLVMSIGFIWSFSFAISIPTLLEYSVQVHMHVTERNQSTTHISCISQASEKLSLSNALFVCIMSYVIPVVLMLKNYLQVAVFVWKRGRRIKDESDNSVPNLGNFHLLTHRVKLVKLLVLVAVIFAVSWLPYFITLLYAKATGSDTSEKATGFVNLLLISLATFSTAYNVVLYHLFNPSFKAAIRETLMCACALGNSNSVQVVAVDIQQINEKTKTNEELKQNGQPMVDDNGRNFIMTTSQI